MYNSETAKKARSKAAPRGPNKVNVLVKDFVSDVFNSLQNDESAKKKRADLKSWAEDNPKDFYNIASKLITVQVSHSSDPDNPVVFKLDERFKDS